MTRIRALVVDDSAFARKVIRESLSRSPSIEVVAIARDGLEALEKIAELKPDVVTLDLVMPNLDGLGVLRALGPDGPAVIVVSISDAHSELAIEALELGAVDLVHKPTALAVDHLYSLADELIAKVVAAAGSRRGAGLAAPEPVPVRPSPRTGRCELIVIGASTGGPQALVRVLSGLPASLPAPVMVALHLPAEYTTAFARRLDSLSPLRVVEASDGIPLEPGLAVISRGGIHLKVVQARGRLLVALDSQPSNLLYRPSVDVLFSSAADAVGAHVLGVVLTGMGDDGLRGAQKIRAAGGRLLTETEESCVVYGMPRVIAEAGLSSGEADARDMAALIVARM